MNFSPRHWNTTSADAHSGFPGEAAVSRVDDRYFRAIEVDAPPSIVFGWVCQLRVAPYSYDWIDNVGRRSPPVRSPELSELSIGARVMFIFDVVSFERDRSMTIRLSDRWGFLRAFGECGITYSIEPGDAGGADQAPRSRLVARLALRYPRGPLGWLLRGTLPVGDLIMMRRQLLNLKRLAEREYRSTAPLPAELRGEIR